jgi:hypothetical protein
MTKQELDHLGNVGEGFENPERIVRPLGPFVTRDLVLKLYDMYTEKPSDIMGVVGNMENFLRKEINTGNIDPKIGLGFVILSKDMLNVVRWDKEYPIVAVNSIYGFPEENRDVMNSKKLSADEIGAYCAWELGIVDHERKAWIKYLNSKRTDEDKANYINNYIEGKLK